MGRGVRGARGYPPVQRVKTRRPQTRSGAQKRKNGLNRDPGGAEGPLLSLFLRPKLLLRGGKKAVLAPFHGSGGVPSQGGQGGLEGAQGGSGGGSGPTGGKKGQKGKTRGFGQNAQNDPISHLKACLGGSPGGVQGGSRGVPRGGTQGGRGLQVGKRAKRAKHGVLAKMTKMTPPGP